MGSTGNDPRPDPSGDHQIPEAGKKNPTHPAPGGAGTGTKGDPANAPDAGPKK